MSGRDAQVYVVSAEVRPLKGSEMWGRATGGFVYCYSIARDARDVMEKVAMALEEDRYEIVAFDWVMPSAEMGWDEGDAKEQQGYASEAEASGDVVYSAFNTYEVEHEH